MDIEQGRLQDAIDLAEELNKNIGPDLAGGLLIQALVKSKKWTDLDEYIDSYLVDDPNTDMLPIYLSAAKECVLDGSSNKASNYLKAAKEVFTPDSDRGRIGDVLYLSNELEETKSVFEELLKATPDDRKALSYLAGLYLLERDQAKSDQMFSKLEEQRAPYQYGEIEYWMARGYMIGGNGNEAVKKLESSVAQGYRYGFNDFQNDFIFTSIKDSPDFQELLKYWH